MGEIIKSSNLEFSYVNNETENYNSNINNNNNYNNTDYNKGNVVQNNPIKHLENGNHKKHSSQLNNTESISNNLYLTNTNFKNSNSEKPDKDKFNFDEASKDANKDKDSNITSVNGRRKSRNSGNDFDSVSKKTHNKNTMERRESNNNNYGSIGHKYQKSQSQNNLDNSQNTKNYLEENIYEIMQSIEKIENN